MRRRRLDLPLPLGPRSRRTSPGSTAKSRPSNTSRAPRRQASARPANAAGRSISESPPIATEGNPDVRASQSEPALSANPRALLRHSRAGGNPGRQGVLIVVWTPACAGVTGENICAASRRDVSGTRRTRSEDEPLGVARCRLPIPDHFGGSLEVGRGLKSGQGGFSDGRRLTAGYGGNGPQ